MTVSRDDYPTFDVVVVPVVTVSFVVPDNTQVLRVLLGTIELTTQPQNYRVSGTGDENYSAEVMAAVLESYTTS